MSHNFVHHLIHHDNNPNPYRVVPHLTCIHCGKRVGTTQTSDPPFLQLLRQNFVPSGTNETLTRALKDEARSEITILDNEVALFHDQAIHDQLKVKRNHMDTCARGYEALLSPIRRLPNEMLSRIFMECLSEGAIDVTSESQSDSTIWNVIQVSLRWRQVALSHHRLWSVWNCGTSYTSEQFQKHYRRLAFCIEHCGTSLLSLTLLFDQTQFSVLQPLLQLIATKHTQLQHLNFARNTLPRTAQFEYLPTPNLRSMELLAVDSHLDVIQGAFGVSPGLTHVVFDQPGRLIISSSIPWHQLTSLILTFYRHDGLFDARKSRYFGDGIFRILSTMPNLSEIGLFSMSFSEPRILVLPRVTTLQFSCHDNRDNHFTVLDALLLPALTYFDLKIPIFDNTGSLRSAVSMLQRSACKLNHLTSNYPHPDIHQLFPFAESLRVLDLDLLVAFDMTPKILSNLICTSHTNSRNFSLPHLEHIRIRLLLSQSDVDVLIDLIISRCAPYTTGHSPTEPWIPPARLLQLRIENLNQDIPFKEIELLKSVTERNRVELFLLPPK